MSNTLTTNNYSVKIPIECMRDQRVKLNVLSSGKPKLGDYGPTACHIFTQQYGVWTVYFISVCLTHPYMKERKTNLYLSSISLLKC